MLRLPRDLLLVIASYLDFNDRLAFATALVRRDLEQNLFRPRALRPRGTARMTDAEIYTALSAALGGAQKAQRVVGQEKRWAIAASFFHKCLAAGSCAFPIRFPTSSPDVRASFATCNFLSNRSIQLLGAGAFRSEMLHAQSIAPEVAALPNFHYISASFPIDETQTLIGANNGHVGRLLWNAEQCKFSMEMFAAPISGSVEAVAVHGAAGTQMFALASHSLGFFDLVEGEEVWKLPAHAIGTKMNWRNPIGKLSDGFCRTEHEFVISGEENLVIVDTRTPSSLCCVFNTNRSRSFHSYFISSISMRDNSLFSAGFEGNLNAWDFRRPETRPYQSIKIDGQPDNLLVDDRGVFLSVEHSLQMFSFGAGSQLKTQPKKLIETPEARPILCFDVRGNNVLVCTPQSVDLLKFKMA